MISFHQPDLIAVKPCHAKHLQHCPPLQQCRVRMLQSWLHSAAPSPMLDGSVSISCLAWGFNPWAALRKTLANLASAAAAAVRYNRQQQAPPTGGTGSSLPATAGAEEADCGTGAVPVGAPEAEGNSIAGKQAVGCGKQVVPIHIDVLGYAGDSCSWAVEMLAPDVPA